MDVERYSHRNARHQLRAQHGLEDAVGKAAAHAGLDRGRWQRQPRGDGELAVLAEDTDIPDAVGAFTLGLEAALAGNNDGRPHGERLRVRVAFHHGTLAPGPFGPAGDAPVAVSRLLDAAPLRLALATRSDRDLVPVVSDSLYENIVSTGFCALDPGFFDPIAISVKGIGYRGMVYAGAPRAPVPAPPAAEEGRTTAGLAVAVEKTQAGSGRNRSGARPGAARSRSGRPVCPAVRGGG